MSAPLDARLVAQELAAAYATRTAANAPSERDPSFDLARAYAIEAELARMRRLVGRATDTPEEIETRLRRAEVELESAVDFPHTVVNDDVQKSALELEKLVRSELSLQ